MSYSMEHAVDKLLLFVVDVGLHRHALDLRVDGWLGFALKKLAPDLNTLHSRVHGQPLSTAVEALVFVANHLHNGKRLRFRIRFMRSLDHSAFGRADGGKELGLFR